MTEPTPEAHPVSHSRRTRYLRSAIVAGRWPDALRRAADLWEAADNCPDPDRAQYLRNRIVRLLMAGFRIPHRPGPPCDCEAADHDHRHPEPGGWE